MNAPTQDPAPKTAFRKTVLQIVPELEAGGAERSTVEIAQGLVAAGGRAVIASRGGRLEADLARIGAAVHRLPVHSKNPAVIFANVGRLTRLMEQEGVDIVHVRSRAPAWSALGAARRTGRPLVSTYHGAYEAKGPLKRLYNSAMVRADCVIANSAYTAKSIRAQYKIDASRLRVIPRGADLDIFTPTAAAAERGRALARSWGVPDRPDALKLLLPARLTFWKGQDVAIAALARLAGASGTGQRRGLQLVLVGDAQGSGDFERTLRRAVEDRGVRDMVYFAGHCADMPAAYLWSDAVLTPATLPEAFGRVAVEAGAMGRPAVASDIGGQRETIIDGRTGFLAPPGDHVALADAIGELVAIGREGRAAMGAAARAHVAALFSAEAMRQATIGVYAELVGEGA
jgi:glycosyltransferase involved in cell wall biosynthesis